MENNEITNINENSIIELSKLIDKTDNILSRTYQYNFDKYPVVEPTEEIKNWDILESFWV